LFDAPGYDYRLLVTSRTEPVLTLWQDYHQRAQIELCLRELKDDLGADGFCCQSFFATDAAFRSVLFTYNLLGEFQRACGLTTWRQPATLRHTVFVCGAALGRSGHHLVLFLSQSWGGLTSRKPLLDKLRQNLDPTAPKLTALPQAAGT
jgi:DNA-directed RNA polymerase subunit N (RpoN/RPB10)